MNDILTQSLRYMILLLIVLVGQNLKAQELSRTKIKGDFNNKSLYLVLLDLKISYRLKFNSSSISIAAPPNNIENGLGIFTGVNSDTVYLEVRKM